MNKILIGGSFSYVQGQFRPNIARLNPDGALDLDYIPAGLNSETGPAVGRLLAVTREGKALVSDENEGRLGPVLLLSTNGVADPGFNRAAIGQRFGFVGAAAIQSDGRLLLVGSIKTRLGEDYLMRFNPDGTEV